MLITRSWPKGKWYLAASDTPIRRGQIWWVDWQPHRGSEQAGRRPSLIVQSNEANELDDYGLTIIVPLSSGGHRDNDLHLRVEPSNLNGLSKTSFVKCEQLFTITKSRLDGFIGQLEPRHQSAVDQNLKAVLAL